MTSTELALANENTVLARMEQARWTSQLATQDKKALAQLAVAYGLDPVMGEIIIYEGKPYITVAGMVRKAHDAQGFEGVEDRPMTEDERKAYGIKQPIGWIAKIYRRGFRVPTIGTGAADPEKPLRNNPVEKERPQWMARSRAIRQALKLAFPHSLPALGLSAAEEIGVDPESGEIIQAPITGVVAGIDHEAISIPTEFTDGDFTEPPAEASAEQSASDPTAELRAQCEAEIRRIGKPSIDKYCQRKFDGKTFAELGHDALLVTLEDLRKSPAAAKAG